MAVVSEDRALYTSRKKRDVSGKEITIFFWARKKKHTKKLHRGGLVSSYFVVCATKGHGYRSLSGEKEREERREERAGQQIVRWRHQKFSVLSEATHDTARQRCLGDARVP